MVAGYTVVDAPTVVATHLNSLVTASAAELFGLDEAQGLVEALKENFPQLATGLTPQPYSIAQIAAVCRALLLERVPLKDFRRIAEAMVEVGSFGLDPAGLIEAVRQRLGALIVQTIVPVRMPLPVITFDPELEALLAQAVRAGPHALYPFEPALSNRLVAAVRDAVQPLLMAARSVAVITAPAIRPAVARLLRAQMAELQRKGQFDKLAEIQYGKLPQLEAQLNKADTAAAKAEGGKPKLLRTQVGAEEIAEVVSRATGIPVSKMMQGERDKLIRMEERLHQRVVGQDEAVRLVSDAIRRSRSGLSDPNRPYGSFLFLGPTGVGKTELTKALAEFLFDSDHALVRMGFRMLLANADVEVVCIFSVGQNRWMFKSKTLGMTTSPGAPLSPVLRRYVNQVAGQLPGVQLAFMQSSGGLAHADQFRGKDAVLSGPAGAPQAGVHYGSVQGFRNLITVDMGGTSYDVSLVRDASPETRTESWFSRHFVGIPMLAIHTIGAGGGSIAWVDSGGALRMGPQSAGARPGPACYGTGGTEATCTDAFLHLGYLNPGFFLGGRMQLDRALATEAIRRNVADRLGMSVDEAAFGMLRIINNNMSNGIRYVSVAEGHDPRDFALMSFGGAGSVTVGTQARDLGIGKVLVPRTASVFCALGELLADLRSAQLHPIAGRVAEIDAAALVAALERLAAPAVADIRRQPGVEEVIVERYAELRYTGQVHELATPMPVDASLSPHAILEQTVMRFHELHKQRYAFAMREKPVEILAVRQDVVGRRGWRIPRFEVRGSTDCGDAIKGRRSVCYGAEGAGFGWIDTPVYDASRLQPGHALAGPAVIEAIDTTIVLQPGDRCRLNEFQVFEIDVPVEAAHADAH